MYAIPFYREIAPNTHGSSSIMALCKYGVSRQEAHEQIRQLSHQSSQVVKGEGGSNDLIERIKKTPFFEPVFTELDKLLDPKTFIGRAPAQVEKFTGKNLLLIIECS
jgi:adenylosuccinate lyase